MNLKELRKKHNLNQTELAKIAQVSQRCISSYENAETSPDLETLTRIADHFHLTLDELVGHEVPYLINKSLLTDKQTKLIEYVTQLTDSQCDKVEAFIMGISMAEIERQDIIQKFKK